MITWLLALTLPVLQAQPITQALSTRWHSSHVIETGFEDPAFVLIFPTFGDDEGHLFAVDSSGLILEMAFINQNWTVLDTIVVGERVTTGCAAALRPDEQWSMILGTATGRLIEMRKSQMGWGKYEFATHKAPLKVVAATEPAKPGPSQIVVLDADGVGTNWYVGASGRWNRKAMPVVPGGASRVCFEQGRVLQAVLAGPRGIIYALAQDSLGNWSGAAWDTMSAGCQELAASADPSNKDACFFYAGTDGHVRYLFHGRRDDVTSRLTCAEDARFLIGKGEQRRINEFFGVVGQEVCLFEYDTGMLEWVKVPIRTVPSPVVSTAFGAARGSIWSTMFVVAEDGRIYEFERDGLEGQ